MVSKVGNAFQKSSALVAQNNLVRRKGNSVTDRKNDEVYRDGAGQQGELFHQVM